MKKAVIWKSLTDYITSKQRIKKQYLLFKNFEKRQLDFRIISIKAKQSLSKLHSVFLVPKNNFS